MSLVERIERGLTVSDDARMVEALIWAVLVLVVRVGDCPERQAVMRALAQAMEPAKDLGR